MNILFGTFLGLLLLVSLCVACIFWIGDKLVHYANQLAIVTKISGAFIGFLLIAAITSMPEMIGTFVSAKQGLYGLAAGGIFGSNMVNLAILSIVCLIYRTKDISIAKTSIFSFLNSLILLAFVGFFVVYHLLSVTLLPSLLPVLTILTFYVFIMYFTFKFHQEDAPQDFEPEEPMTSKPRVYIGFGLSAIGIIVVSWFMVLLCENLSIVPIPFYGKALGEHFVGTLILALATSIPELATTVQLVRNNSIDMGIENISGSNVFNLMVLSLASFVSPENLWIEIPYNSLYTIFAIFIASLLICLLGLIKHSKRLALGVYSTVIMIWIMSLRLVF